VLVVDDEPEIAGVLADLLALDGHRVEIAGNGVHALDKLREGAYDLVVSDIRMPELDGPGLYREIKQRHPDLCRRFVFVTGDALTPETTAFLAETRAPSVGKPFAAADVRRVTQQLLRQGQRSHRQ
jgi:CheY-like chemotaxis protein